MRPSSVLSPILTPSFALDVIDDFVRAAQHARDVGADSDVVASDGFCLKHRVKRCDLINLNRRQLEVVRNCVHKFGGQVTIVLVLHDMQSTDDSGALPAFRKLGLPLLNLLSRGRKANLNRSSVDLTKNNVLRTDDGNHIGQHVPFHHLRHR